MNEIFLISGMALVTVLIRYPVIGMSGRIKLSPQFLRVLSFVPPAVLTAIIFPAVLMPSGSELMVSYTNARLVGSIAAILVGFWRKNLLWTIVVGMIVFFAWQWLLRVLAIFMQ